MSAEKLIGTDIRTSFPLQDNEGRSWWTCTDPWGGLAIRTGHRERLLIIPGRGEVLVTAPLRPSRPQPAGQLASSSRSATPRLAAGPRPTAPR